MKRFLISITILIIFTNPTTGQSDDSSFETWSDITTIYNFSDRWQYNGDQGIRGVLSGSDFTALYVRPSVRYRVKPWFTVHGGIKFAQTFFENDEDTFELRPWQGLRFTWPKIDGYIVTHYLRLEERMKWSIGQSRDFDFTLRSRYKIGAKSPNFDILFDNGIFLSASVEAFWNVREGFFENFVNRIRYQVGVGTKVSDAWLVQLNYIQQDGRTIEQDAFSTNQHIMRLRLFYQFN